MNKSDEGKSSFCILFLLSLYLFVLSVPYLSTIVQLKLVSFEFVMWDDSD